MTNETIAKTKAAIAALTQDAAEKDAALTAQGRQDEADLEKIRGNVAQIAGSVLTATLVLDQTGETAKRRFCGIVDKWREHRVIAREHGDETQVLVEDVKIAAAERIVAIMEA